MKPWRVARPFVLGLLALQCACSTVDPASRQAGTEVAASAAASASASAPTGAPASAPATGDVREGRAWANGWAIVAVALGLALLFKAMQAAAAARILGSGGG